MKKILFCISFIISVLISVNCYSQWVSIGPTGDITALSLAVSGTNIFAGTNGYGVYLSTNNGQSWKQTSLYNPSVFSLVLNGNNIFAGTYGFGVYLSTNNGQDWTQTPLNNRSVWALALSGTNIFAGTDLGVYRSTNNGQNWTQTVLNNQWVKSLAINGTNIFAGTDNSGIYLSTNNGQSWTQTVLNSEHVYSLAVSGNNLFAGTINDGVYFSSNNGQYWILTALNNKTVNSLAASGNNIFAGTNLYGIYLSTNNGNTWIEKNQGLGSLVVPSLCLNSTYIFAGTEMSVWRRSIIEIIGIKNISTEVPSEYKLYQNFPNPFNPTTNLRYKIRDGGFVSLKIFDVLGKEIAVLVNEKQSPGTFEVTFNASLHGEDNNINSGLYFYKLIVTDPLGRTGDFTDTKKMILLK